MKTKSEPGSTSPPTPKMVVRVAVVEDNLHFRQSLEFVINNSDGYQCVGAFEDAESALEGIPTLRPDVVIMDLRLPRMSGTECVRTLNSAVPDIPIMILTVEESPPEVIHALKAGAVGYLVKHESIGKVLEAIHDVSRGGSPMSPSIARLVIRSFHEPSPQHRDCDQLTERERTILDSIVDGMHRKEIAQKLGISERTVGSHLRHIYKKLHVNSLAHAVIQYLGYSPALPASQGEPRHATEIGRLEP